ncbi:uncharacterized protein LOC129300436 isoform X1 [Prosopis cineraria]|uniref:uncharacterized protein LOC129300436 isoform X1 n=1 Tax=Prosopis cineraria TaxID=364024 RepID=UPI00240F71FC|nr:uncharacterized protein LOC129300436 isoform X1 [Prosopis cineraria]
MAWFHDHDSFHHSFDIHSHPFPALNIDHTSHFHNQFQQYNFDYPPPYHDHFHPSHNYEFFNPMSFESNLSTHVERTPSIDIEHLEKLYAQRGKFYCVHCEAISHFYYDCPILKGYCEPHGVAQASQERNYMFQVEDTQKVAHEAIENINTPQATQSPKEKESIQPLLQEVISPIPIEVDSSSHLTLSNDEHNDLNDDDVDEEIIVESPWMFEHESYCEKVYPWEKNTLSSHDNSLDLNSNIIESVDSSLSLNKENEMDVDGGDDVSCMLEIPIPSCDIVNSAHALVSSNHDVLEKGCLPSFVGEQGNVAKPSLDFKEELAQLEKAVAPTKDLNKELKITQDDKEVENQGIDFTKPNSNENNIDLMLDDFDDELALFHSTCSNFLFTCDCSHDSPCPICLEINSFVLENSSNHLLDKIIDDVCLSEINHECTSLEPNMLEEGFFVDFIGLNDDMAKNPHVLRGFIIAMEETLANHEDDQPHKVMKDSTPYILEPLQIDLEPPPKMLGMKMIMSSFMLLLKDENFNFKSLWRFKLGCGM